MLNHCLTIATCECGPGRRAARTQASDQVFITSQATTHDALTSLRLSELSQAPDSAVLYVPDRQHRLVRSETRDHTPTPQRTARQCEPVTFFALRRKPPANAPPSFECRLAECPSTNVRLVSHWSGTVWYYSVVSNSMCGDRPCHTSVSDRPVPPQSYARPHRVIGRTDPWGRPDTEGSRHGPVSGRHHAARGCGPDSRTTTTTTRPPRGPCTAIWTTFRSARDL